MRNFLKGLIIATGFVPSVVLAQKTVQIDVKSNVHSISPYIYGANASFDKATATRWGGNRSSSYNWENNASNGGNDYNFVSDNHYDYTQSHTPATPILSSSGIDADMVLMMSFLNNTVSILSSVPEPVIRKNQRTFSQSSRITIMGGA